ncbi:metallophosphoesterase family protein [Candidatus Gracilibacteria bacterium]|nr:metallophosphoesterase family protein [Candidatus Gracilibacteria bacterium]
MKLAILSDIHDQVWNLRAALAHISDAQVDTVLCCGDLCSPFVVGILASGFPGPIHAVSGNNEGDWRQIMVNAASANTSRKADAQIVFHGQFFAATFDNIAVAVNHYPEIALPIAASGQYDLVCFGHNHHYELRSVGPTSCLIPAHCWGTTRGNPAI